MRFIKNFNDLAKTPERKIVLELAEEALRSIQPEEVFKSKIQRHRNILTIGEKEFDLDDYKNVYILGFGKGSAGNSKLLEDLVIDRLTEGFVIDTAVQKFKKIEGTVGTHPLPSEVNFKFTQKALSHFSNLTEHDLVLVVICGGGSAMFVHPHSISLMQKIEVGKALLKSGATISQMNAVRKHLSDVKGGGLAQILYPATVATMIYSDVPGNDLSVIASGPTVEDVTTVKDALKIVSTFGIDKQLNLPINAFVENPHDKKYFKNVHNIIVLSNETALSAMQEKAKKLGRVSKIFSDRFESDAKVAGEKLVSATHHKSILLIGGETTVHVTKKSGRGGRNQALVLAELERMNKDITICSFDSDGWDNSEHAGALGDFKTVERARKLNLDPEKYLKNDDSLDFFSKTGDAIITGRLPSNVSDLMIVLRK
ncbi:MAG: hypothetical protein A2776_00265 [Candidatus Levybacteria bacterium RIFCSPHIGHO2_01_FULL_40_10]|nr:MAG: hypothetical protein A2776_00265 [Candidatus Levybacteria bacterium RIFCSPHIGHO2_01_FULL_40_10]